MLKSCVYQKAALFFNPFLFHCWNREFIEDAYQRNFKSTDAPEAGLDLCFGTVQILSELTHVKAYLKENKVIFNSSEVIKPCTIFISGSLAQVTSHYFKEQGPKIQSPLEMTKVPQEQSQEC